MLQKSSQAGVSDRCGVWEVNVFHVYKGFRHTHARTGSFVKVSIRRTRPNNWLKRGKKSKAVIIRTRFKVIKPDGSYVRFSSNAVVLLKKRMTPRGKELVGPITYGLRRRKFVSSFGGVV
jgi:large subunit ribosomal protein L14